MCTAQQCMNQTVSLGFITGPSSSARPAEMHIATGKPKILILVFGVSSKTEIHILIKKKGQAPSKVQLMVYQCQDSSCTSLYALGKHCYHGPGYVLDIGNGQTELAQSTYVPHNIMMSVGNLYGRGLRVSQPEHWTFEGIPKLIAVINAPPTHLDYFDGVPLVVNVNTAAGLIFLPP